MSSNDYQSLHEYDVTSKAVASYGTKREKLNNVAPTKIFFLGFDGYIDLIYSLVASREGSKKWQRMKSMKDFGTRILETAGSSCNIERVLKKEIAGGFAPNTARALDRLGTKVILAAAMGKPEPKSLFREYSHRVNLHSIQDHGTTICLEFDDGKVMTTDFGSINSLTWNTILHAIPRDNFINLIEQSDAIGQGHWALVPNMNDIWKGMIQDIFPNLSMPMKKIFMVDVADITKRSDDDVLKMLRILHQVEDFMPTVLSMNDRETIEISKILSQHSNNFGSSSIQPIEGKEDYFDIGKRMNELIDLSYITTHDPHFATITTRKQHFWVTEGFTAHPNFTTAAGDHYNAGLLLGLICKLEPYESLVLGNAVTAIFVRTGISPSLQDVNTFISNYFHYIENDDNSFNLDS